jgi:hypothetical protein
MSWWCIYATQAPMAHSGWRAMPHGRASRSAAVSQTSSPLS